MKFSMRQIFMIFAVFIVVFGILRGAQWIYVRSAVRSPLKQSISRIRGVSRVQVASHNIVTVTLDKNANLMTAYDAIDSASKEVTGRTQQNLIIRDHANASMDRMVNSLQLIIAQGAATGQYVAMNQAIQSLAKSHHMTAVVELGDRHIFVTLRSKNHWLDQVMPLRMGGGRA